MVLSSYKNPIQTVHSLFYDFFIIQGNFLFEHMQNGILFEEIHCQEIDC